MSRKVAPLQRRDHGRTHRAQEPLVFHCNFYNYWLQKTLLLDPDLEMERVLHDASAAAAYASLTQSAKDLGADSAEERVKIAEDTFADQGFGTVQLSPLLSEKRVIDVPVSHYGKCLSQAITTDFGQPQTFMDAGYIAAAAAFVWNHPVESLCGKILQCQALGAEKGVVELVDCAEGRDWKPACGIGPGGKEAPPPPNANTNVDEGAILQALSGLDLAGDEEGLLPRFGVMLTNHFGNFYNRISFEFLHKMNGTGLLEAGEMLLQDAGYRCGFHTFGGIMESAEWDAVVKPQCKTQEDWVHGMVAVVNALGWGVWRVVELDDQHIVMRIYDDYESTGWLGMYGQSDRPVSHLATAGVAGLMNTIYLGDIQSKPTLDLDYYAKVFEIDGAFTAEETKSLSMGHAYTEIVAQR